MTTNRLTPLNLDSIFYDIKAAIESNDSKAAHQCLDNLALHLGAQEWAVPTTGTTSQTSANQETNPPTGVDIQDPTRFTHVIVAVPNESMDALQAWVSLYATHLLDQYTRSSAFRPATFPEAGGFAFEDRVRSYYEEAITEELLYNNPDLNLPEWDDIPITARAILAEQLAQTTEWVFPDDAPLEFDVPPEFLAAITG